ncbi:MAG TPA: TMEM165/GDT1 family protein [Burkholderiaceae bacterium]|nr:TMEM165/GDT1 family protein [Burkholderiaceae bacterium]
MSVFLLSAGVIALAEIGDKTQLLAMMLSARTRRPWMVIGGMFVATVLNHAVAGALGHWVSRTIDPQWLRWILGLSFIAMAAWTLIPDKLNAESKPASGRWGVFGTTLIAFFLLEIGDKTQIATIALAARYESLVAVVLGTTFGMMIANVPAALFGDVVARRVPMRWVRATACVLFLVVGLAVLFGLPMPI